MATRQVVFVRGGHTHEQFPWMFFHFDPFKDTSIGAVDLVYFDYPDGNMKIWKKWVPKRGTAPPSAAPDSATALTPTVQMRLSDGSLDSGDARPSVLAFYNWMKVQTKGSVAALHIFSHGYYEGPILWAPCFENSDKHDLTAARDPNDTEFRTRDFFGTNPLAGVEGRKFADVFENGALIKLWGCNEGRSDPDTGEWIEGYGLRGMVKRYMAARRGAPGDATRAANLEPYLDAIDGSFQMTMSLKLGLPIWAGPLGWGSDPYEEDAITKSKLRYTGKFPPKLGKDQWWRVSDYFRGNYRKFYDSTLKARIDATRYVEHRKLWFEDAKRVATAALEAGPIDSPTALQRRLTDQAEALKIS